jgi:hypothetical protein
MTPGGYDASALDRCAGLTQRFIQQVYSSSDASVRQALFGEDGK